MIALYCCKDKPVDQWNRIEIHKLIIHIWSNYPEQNNFDNQFNSVKEKDFSTNVLKQLNILIEIDELQANITLYTKSNLKRTIDLSTF